MALKPQQTDQLLDHVVKQITNNVRKVKEFYEGFHDGLIDAVVPHDCAGACEDICGGAYGAGSELARQLQEGDELSPISSKICPPNKVKEIISMFETRT